jgi:hypothetical protein
MSNYHRVRGSGPAYPFSGCELFRDLHRRLSEAAGRRLTLEDLTRITGQPRSTVHYWLEVHANPQVAGLMTLIERLPFPEREDFLRTHCREFPTLSHPRLAHSPAKLRSLFALLDKQVGVTFITCGSVAARTFVATALAHSYLNLLRRHSEVCGIDLHRPDHWVPVPNVRYVDLPGGRAQVDRLVEETWPALVTSASRLLLLNGVWSLLPAIRDRVVQCGESKHVLVTAELPPARKTLRTPSSPTDEVVVSEVNSRCRVHCRRLH